MASSPVASPIMSTVGSPSTIARPFRWHLSSGASLLMNAGFQIALKLPKKGYYEIWARATDDSGLTQPIVAPGWNTGGYGNNQIHRIAIRTV